jgi:hypothetical protein
MTTTTTTTSTVYIPEQPLLIHSRRDCGIIFFCGSVWYIGEIPGFAADVWAL